MELHHPTAHRSLNLAVTPAPYTLTPPNSELIARVIAAEGTCDPVGVCNARQLPEGAAIGR